MKLVRIAVVFLCASAIGQATDLRGIEYSRIGGTHLRMDARIPEGIGPFPAAILVHGGAWVAGSRRFDVRPLFKPLSNAGYAWFSISYRLARATSLHPSVIDPSKIADGIDDVGHAVEFVRSHAAEFQVDPNRIVLIGESAGAQLASMAAIRGAPVKGVVAFYCPSDLVALARQARILSRVTWGNVSEPNLRELSPIDSVHPGMPPFLLIHGTMDHVIPAGQSVHMCEEMRRNGATCDLELVKGGLHGVHLWEAFHKTAYKRWMIDWMNQL